MTIKDLAALSGYSLGTVSRLLNNQPHVSEKTREQIMARVKEQGFELNTNARNLKQTHSNNILVIVRGTHNELFATLVERLQTVATGGEYQLVVDYIGELDNEVRRAVKRVRDTRAQRQLPETCIGFVLRMYPAIDLRRGLLRGDNAATASAYEILPLLAMARGNFLPPLRNTLRIRPGGWADFLAVSGGGDKEKRRYCCHAAATLAETEIWEVMNDREDT